MPLFKPEEIIMKNPKEYETKNTLFKKLEQAYETNSAG